MVEPPATPFIDKLIAWDDFEIFVRDLYSEDPSLSVQRDVVMFGKSGAKRQVDVLVTHKTRFHTYSTVVECKRWKDKVDRPRIDILYATMEDLNASKGVMFTTVGYEEGALEYAKAKGIDLFTVRDLTPEEWGLPGREVHFFLQFFSSRIENLQLPSAIPLPTSPDYPQSISLGLTISKDTPPDDKWALYSVDSGEKGPNLVPLLTSVQQDIESRVSGQIPLLEGGREDARLVVRTDAEVDCTDYQFRQLRFSWGALLFDKMRFVLTTYVTQSVFHHDRGKNLDLALAVESMLTKRRHVATRPVGESALTISDRLYDTTAGETAGVKDDTLKNGSVFKCILAPWVTFRLDGTEHTVRTNAVRIRLRRRPDNGMSVKKRGETGTRD